MYDEIGPFQILVKPVRESKPGATEETVLEGGLFPEACLEVSQLDPVVVDWVNALQTVVG